MIRTSKKTKKKKKKKRISWRMKLCSVMGTSRWSQPMKTSGPVLSDEENSISSSVQTGPITYGIEDAGFGNDDQDDDSDNDEQAFPATNAGKEQGVRRRSC